MLTANDMLRWCKANGWPPSRLGREAVNDPRLYWDVRGGRKLYPSTEKRIRAFMEAVHA